MKKKMPAKMPPKAPAAKAMPAKGKPAAKSQPQWAGIANQMLGKQC